MKTYSFHGHPCCRCAYRWLTVYEKLLLLLGVIREKLDVYQLIGSYSASAGTHRPGGAHDLAQRDALSIKVAREMGCMAHDRPPGWDGGSGIGHQHGVLIGCRHNAGGRYQVAAGMRGYNGLGSGGMGGPIAGWVPKRWRTWRTGILWARKEIRRIERANRKPRIKVLNWNVKVGRDADKVMGPLREKAAKHRPHIITVQEFRLHADRVIPGYVNLTEDKKKGVDGRVNEHASCGIFVRKDLKVRRDHVAAMEQEWAHTRPHDPRRFPVVAVEAEGRLWRWGSFHRPTKGNPPAIAEAIQWAVLWLHQDRKGQPSGLSGDWNQKDAPKGVTAEMHGIDGVWSDGCHVVSSANLGAFGSDHDMWLYTIECD